MEGLWNMLVGYMRVSSDSDRQTTDLQHDALLAAGVDERHLFEDKASGARSDRSGLAAALDYVRAERLPGGVEARPPRPVVASPPGNRYRTRSQAGRVSFPDRADGIRPRHTARSCSACSVLWRSMNGPWQESGSWQAWRQPGNAAGGAGAHWPSIPKSWRRSGWHSKTAPARPAVCRNFGVKRTTLYRALARCGSEITKDNVP